MNDQPETPEDRLLFVTDEAFQIKARGCVLTPGLPRDFAPIPSGGSPLLLRRPDGSVLSCQLAATEMISLARSATIPILLLPPVHKSEVPSGTEVWLVFSAISA